MLVIVPLWTLLEPGMWLKPIDVMGTALSLLVELLDIYYFCNLSSFSATIIDISFYLDTSAPSSTRSCGSSTN